MIVVKLIGGLGNQMFQYAAGRSLALFHRTELLLDTSSLKGDSGGAYTARNYELVDFKIDAEIADKKEVVLFNFESSKIITKFKSLFPRFFKKIHFNESQSFFHKQFFKLPKSTYLDGYWQNERYFSSIRGILINEFDIKEKSPAYKTVLAQITSCNATSVHVRHGDYVTLTSANTLHGVLPLAYYSSAVEHFTKLDKNAVFFVFSDDLNWCREHFVFIKNLNFVDGSKLGLSSKEELLLMSHCGHNIIANSSFSWWAAWLNTNAGKNVVAPQNWFNSGQKQPEELIPKDWIRL